MREYVLHQALAQQMTYAGSPISRILANMRARRAARHLRGYDDFMLRDIGLTRGDIERVATMPLWTMAPTAFVPYMFGPRF